jgi:hypothetical protein
VSKGSVLGPASLPKVQGTDGEGGHRRLHAEISSRSMGTSTALPMPWIRAMGRKFNPWLHALYHAENIYGVVVDDVM